ncbi:MAG: hypothetical protein DMG41_21350 [Acidobacteria bacterium]|nr:MAG: hypothetical protein DMG42_27100 [Acidobacteriota bacterium]PYT85911.1 MAG: hypothetical protein DMG41_21350 [Acidobacteriota bacterium]
MVLTLPPLPPKARNAAKAESGMERKTAAEVVGVNEVGGAVLTLVQVDAVETIGIDSVLSRIRSRVLCR